VLHAIEGDQGASATEASFAVNGDGTGLLVSKVLLTHGQKLVHDVLWWRRPVYEDHVIVGYTLALEGCLVVLRVVQSDDTRNV
jgi:hypothetical protein